MSAGREAALMNLNQVTVASTDVRRSIDFYRSLGLVLMVEDLPSYARFECPEGDATFSVHQTGQPPVSPGVVVYFECDDPGFDRGRAEGRRVAIRIRSARSALALARSILKGS
jgi:catechol 2,3-dioxygenase-like lactoylglutathione lyase family enzyme